MSLSKILWISVCILCSLSLLSKNPEKNNKNDSVKFYYSIKLANQYYQDQLYDSAILYYKNSLRFVKKAHNRKGSFDLYYNLSKAYLENHMFDSSLVYALRSLNVLANIKHQDKTLKIKQLEKSYYLTGHVFSILNEYDIALEYYNIGIKYLDTLSEIDTKFDKRINLSFYYTNIGHIFSEKGQYEKAIDYYKSSIQLQKNLKTNYEFYSTYNYLSIAELLLSSGDFHQALVYYNHLVNIYMRNPGAFSNEVGITYNNIGLAYFNKCEYLKALNYFNKAKQIIEEPPNNSEEIIANIYSNIGNVYRKLNKNLLAKSFFKKVAAIYHSLYNDRSLEVAFIYNNYANLFKDIGDNDLALYNYFRALSIRKERLGTKHDKIAQIYQNIGIVYNKEELYDSALLFFQKALCANVYSFNDLGINANPDVSSNIISKLELIETLILKAETLLCKIEEDRITADDSIVELVFETYDIAIKISDLLRNDYLNDESRLFLNSMTHRILRRSLILLNLNSYDYSGRLFGYLERIKNFELYSRLNIQNVKKSIGIPEEIIEKEKEYNALIKTYQNSLSQLSEKDSVYKSTIEKKLFEISTAYELFILNLEDTYPGLKTLKSDYIIPNIEAIQINLNDKQVLISYYYQDTMLYVFMISKDTMLVNIAYSHIFQNNYIQEFLNCLNIVRIDEFYKYSHLLYQDLIGPIEKFIQNKDELLFIPYGMLYYVPFETLICEPVKSADSSTNRFLINNHTIKYHYSSALWNNSLKKSFNENINYVYEYDFIGFAPVFLNQDPDKYLESLNQNQIDKTHVDCFNSITPLPYSGEEVNKIFLLFKSKNKNAKQFLLQNATEEKFKTKILRSKYIHLASHSFVNEIEPSLSGIIFYDYLFKNQSCDKNVNLMKIDEDDGILYLNEIFNLKIDAELAVLSTCESGVGKLEDSEGLMSMARGLLYTGVENIIISLFKVPDKITKFLMVSFYENILSGYSYAESLKKAKIDIINKGLTFPKIWSSFVLIGL